MLSTSVSEAPIPHNVDAHPRVADVAKDLQAMKLKAQAARDVHDQLVSERTSLEGPSVTAMLTLGRATRKNVDEKVAELDAQIVKATIDVTARDTALRQLEIDLKGVRSQAKAEIQQMVIDRIRDLFRRMNVAFSEADKLAAEVAALRQRYQPANLPAAHAIALDFADKWRGEARRFGVTLD